MARFVTESAFNKIALRHVSYRIIKSNGQSFAFYAVDSLIKMDLYLDQSSINIYAHQLKIKFFRLLLHEPLVVICTCTS